MRGKKTVAGNSQIEDQIGKVRGCLRRRERVELEINWIWGRRAIAVRPKRIIKVAVREKILERRDLTDGMRRREKERRIKEAEARMKMTVWEKKMADKERAARRE